MKVFQRVRRLITETAKTPFAGIGKPEQLKGNLKGYWSRRITDEHRLVYKATADQLDYRCLQIPLRVSLASGLGVSLPLAN